MTQIVVNLPPYESVVDRLQRDKGEWDGAELTEIALGDIEALYHPKPLDGGAAYHQMIGKDWGATPKLDGECVLFCKDNKNSAGISAFYNASGNPVPMEKMPDITLSQRTEGYVFAGELIGHRSLKDRIKPTIIIHDVWIPHATSIGYVNRLKLIETLFPTWDMYLCQQTKGIYAAPNITPWIEDHWIAMQDWNKCTESNFFEGFVFKRWSSALDHGIRNLRTKGVYPPTHHEWIKCKFDSVMT